MAKQRVINTHFWDDSFIVNLDPIEKLLFLYLLTNPLTDIAGAYEINVRRIAFDTGIDREMILKILERFEKANKVVYKEGWILVINFVKNQANNPNVKKGVERSLSHCPDWVKDRLSKPIRRPSHSTKPNLSEELNLSEERKSAVDVVFNHWRSVMNHPTAKLVKERKAAVEARLKEGYTVDHIKRAIEGCKKSPHHNGQNDTHTVYDDLELICRTGTNVEKFANFLERGVFTNGKNNNHAATNSGDRNATRINERKELVSQLLAASPEEPGVSG